MERVQIAGGILPLARNALLLTMIVRSISVSVPFPTADWGCTPSVRETLEGLDKGEGAAA